MKRILLDFFTLMMGAAAFAGWLRRRAAELRTPRCKHFAPEDYRGELFEVACENGLVMRGKRYRNTGAVPLILMHGFAGNGYNFDLPFEDCNFALYLARRGYDVWIANFPGAGREPYKSDGGDFTHSIEDLVVHVAPALLDAVTLDTGRKPVWIGHSMGAVVAYGYLQGVRHLEVEGRMRLVPDDGRAKECNGRIEALVSMAGPTCFRWPSGSKLHWLVETPLSRVVLRWTLRLLTGLSGLLPRVPVEDMAIRLPGIFPRSGVFLFRKALSFSKLFINLDNVSDEVFLETLLCGASDVSMTETIQMVEAMINRDFTESAASNGDAAGEPHNYTEGIDRITVPVLFVTGDADSVNYRTVYETGYLKVSSDIREYRCFPDFSHLDLVLGREAGKRVHPFVADWLDRVVGDGGRREARGMSKSEQGGSS